MEHASLDRSARPSAPGGGQRGGIRRKSECRLPERPGRHQHHQHHLPAVCGQQGGRHCGYPQLRPRKARYRVAGTDIPVIFSAVTDPAAWVLWKTWKAPEGNITGTSDAIPVEKIFELAAELAPDAESFGFIRNTGEVNSVSVIDETKAIWTPRAFQLHRGQRCQHRRRADGGTDAAFQMRRNFCAHRQHGGQRHGCAGGRGHQGRKARVCGGRQHGERRGLATVGVNYTNLGTQTADMLLKVYNGRCKCLWRVLKENAVVVNEETAAAIGVDVSKSTPDKKRTRKKGHCNEKQERRTHCSTLCCACLQQAARAGLPPVYPFPTRRSLFWCGFRYTGRKRPIPWASSSRWNTPLWTRSGRPVEAGLAGARLRAAITVERST